MSTIMNLGIDHEGRLHAELEMRSDKGIQLERICADNITDFARGTQGLAMSPWRNIGDYDKVVVNPSGYNTHSPVTQDVAHVVSGYLSSIFKSVEMAGNVKPQGGYKQ
jgi:hypothetical protein